jgi:hypothetical protein
MRAKVEVKKRQKVTGRKKLKLDRVELISASAYLADAVEAFTATKK